MGRGAPILIIRKILQIIFGLITFAVVARTLSKEHFAIYSLVFSFIAILRLITFPGLGSATAQSFARGFGGSFKYAVKFSFLGSFLGAIVFLVISFWHFYIGKVETAQAFIITAFCFPFATGLIFWRNAAVGEERYIRLLLFDVLSTGLKCGSIIICAYLFPANLPLIVTAALVAPALINIFATWDQLKRIPSDAKIERGSLRYGFHITFYQLPTTLVQHLDKIILFYFISPTALAIYTVALRIPELIRTMVGEINATLGPIFARENTYTSALHQFSLKLFFLYLFLSVLVAFFAVPYVLRILVGSSYMSSIRFAQFMTIGVALGFLGDIRFRYIRSHLHSKNFLRVALSRALFDSLLIVMLVYCFGLKGAVVAYIIRNIAFSLITTAVMKFNYLGNQKSNIYFSERNIL